MRWLGSRLPIRKDYVTLRQAALRFVQARRSNPIVVCLLLILNFAFLYLFVEEGFSSADNRC